MRILQEEKYEHLFLQALSIKINAETNYTANYGGKRDYFVGYQFLKMNWRFVFVYKNNHQAELFLESYQKEYSDRIQSILDEKVQDYVDTFKKFHSTLELLFKFSF